MAWSFNGTSFAVVAGDPVFDEWFPTTVEHTVDTILDGAVYVDIGAVTRGPLSLVAQVTSTATRDTLAGLIGTSATLADDNSRTCTAVMVEATYVRVKTPSSGKYRLNLVFVYVS